MVKKGNKNRDYRQAHSLISKLLTRVRKITKSSNARTKGCGQGYQTQTTGKDYWGERPKRTINVPQGRHTCSERWVKKLAAEKNRIPEEKKKAPSATHISVKRICLKFKKKGRKKKTQDSETGTHPAKERKGKRGENEKRKGKGKPVTKRERALHIAYVPTGHSFNPSWTPGEQKRIEGHAFLRSNRKKNTFPMLS